MSASAAPDVQCRHAWDGGAGGTSPLAGSSTALGTERVQCTGCWWDGWFHAFCALIAAVLWHRLVRVLSSLKVKFHWLAQLLELAGLVRLVAGPKWNGLGDVSRGSKGIGSSSGYLQQ